MKPDDVARYLQGHPEFFEQYAELLSQLHIPSPHGGRAVSITERQIGTLREKVRELVLSNSGPMLTDVYSAGGEVLMGTLRWEKEAEEIARQKLRRVEFEHKQRELEFAEADTQARIKVLELDLQRQQAELALYTLDGEARVLSSSERENELRRMRSADQATRAEPAVIPPAGPTNHRDASCAGTGKKASKEE